MKSILSLLFAGLSFLVCESQINQVEYFWDQDPGLGNGISVNVAPSFQINEALNVSTSGISQGHHVLYVRTHDVSGDWSPTSMSEIFVHSFEGAEYFWDQDPGLGNGSPLTLTGNSIDINSNFSISTSNIKQGSHDLYVRLKGSGDAWGIASTKRIWIENKIVGAEYYWDHDPGVGNGTSLNIGSPSLDLDFTDLVSTEPLDTAVDIHYLVVRTKGMNGAWSVAVDTALFLGPVSVQEWNTQGLHQVVYPNPCNDVLNISLFTPEAMNVQLELLNSNGGLIQKLFNGNLRDRWDYKIDTSNLEGGVYFLRFISDDKTWVQRVVVN